MIFEIGGSNGSLMPLKRSRLRIINRNESINGLPHLAGRGKGGSLQRLPPKDAKPALYLIKPGDMRWRVVKMNMRMTPQPVISLGPMSVKIIQHYMDFFIRTVGYHVLNPGVKAYLEKLFPIIMKGLPGCEIIKYNIQPDHIHMVMIIQPKYSVSGVVGKMKGMTSSRLRKKFGWMKLRYSRENVFWSPGYFVSTVGVDEARLLKYVEYQGRQDSGQAKLEI